MHADGREFQRVVERIKDEATKSRLRWKRLYEFQQSLAQLQSVYCLTVHRSQGSTFETVFVDLSNIRRREKTNLLEAQQMLYVAVTRPSLRLIVITTDFSPGFAHQKDRPGSGRPLYLHRSLHFNY
jgi:ATP-dependent exoDNAse (exonuclease V) alpha subunit